MPNGKVLAGIMSGLALAAIVAAGSAVKQTWANEVRIDANAKVCEKHRENTEGMPAQIASIEVHVETNTKTLDKIDRKLDRLLMVNGGD